MGGDVEFPGGSMRCCALWRGWMVWVTGSGVRVTVKHSVYDVCVCVYDLFSLLYTYWVVHIKRGKFALWGLKMHKLLHALSSAYQWAQQAWLVWDLGYPDVSLSFCAFAKKKKNSFFFVVVDILCHFAFFPHCCQPWHAHCVTLGMPLALTVWSDKCFCSIVVLIL